MPSQKRLMHRLISNLSSGGPGKKGALIGFAFALSWVLFGLGKTLFILLMTGIGYFVAVRYFSNKEDFKDLLDKIFPPGMFR